jgi:hypothetical protein
VAIDAMTADWVGDVPTSAAHALVADRSAATERRLPTVAP